ncbi:hypothetical protein [Streptomyces sp. NPDC001530]|uniref:hypothetical protein n=1 Tax=Streptomyces sp. NPDC001530 TaxID=3364582 RepID=UPI00369897B6
MEPRLDPALARALDDPALARALDDPALAQALDGPALAQALDDPADAQDRRPEEGAREAVRAYLGAQAAHVRSLAESLAKEHAELLRRLGE